MPRTRRRGPAKPKRNKVMEEIIKKKIDAMEKEMMEVLDKKEEEELQELEVFLLNKKSKFPKKLWLKTVGEIVNGEVHDSELTSTSVLKDHTFLELYQSTRSLKKNTLNSTTQRSRARRSVSASVLDDDGYSTGSGRSTHSGIQKQPARQSRSRIKNTPLRVSRSLSKTYRSKLDSYKTPANRAPPTNTGTITPKCAVGTPVMCVRRPKLGEMAWSHHGSPLMVSSTVVNEESANINIPVKDQVLSLLPTRGEIDATQLPTMEDHTVRQLENLRDNLISLCNTFKP